MYGVEEQTDCEPRGYYRCPIDADKSAAKLKLGTRTVRGSVLDKSINGYSLLVKRRYGKKLRVGQRFKMQFDGTTVEVQVRRVGDADKGYTRVGLALTRDMTPPGALKSSWWPSLLRPGQKAGEGTAQIAFAGFVLVLFCAMAMPGLGDRLGTSDRIQDAFRWIINSADAEVNAMAR